VGTYNAKIREIVNELSGDGLNVTLADAGGAYDPNSTDLASDNFHPSDTGHAHIADAFLRAMQTSVVAGDRGGRQ
jgi:lysophospholipase L1-like esterase